MSSIGRYKIEKPLSVLAMAICAASPLAENAEEAAAYGADSLYDIEEIIVTATKRSTNLQDTAVAISAFDAKSMDKLGITSAEDFALHTPSVSYSDSPSRLFVRGVGRIDNALGLDPGVAVYVDGIYQQEVDQLSTDSFEVNRVEILRGPQGTFFGRNATGGAVNIISKRPAEEFEHRVRAKVGNYELKNVAVSSSGPLTENIGYRVSASQSRHDGYIENVSGTDMAQKDSFGVRAQLQIDNLFRDSDLWLMLNYSESNEADTPEVVITPYVTDDEGSLVLDGLYGWDKINPAVENPRKVDFNDVGVETLESLSFAAKLTVPLEGLTFVSSTGGRKIDYAVLGSDGDGGSNPNPLQRHIVDLIQTGESISQEFQLTSDENPEGGLQWVAGVYFYHEESTQPYWQRSPGSDGLDHALPLDDILAQLGAGAPPFVNAVDSFERTGRTNTSYHQTGELETNSHAVYFDANYTFNEEWRLSAGIRYSVDKKTVFEDQYAVVDLKNLKETDIDAIGLIVIDESREDENTWRDTSYRLVLDYQPNEDSLIYASLATGYKAGGYQLGSLQGDSLAGSSFDSEQVISYEVGVKTLINDVLRLNGAVFYYQYDDMQTVSFESVLGVTTEALINIPEVDSYGVELEVLWHVNENLRLTGGFSHIDSKFTKSGCLFDEVFPHKEDAKCADLGPGFNSLEGNPTPYSPKNKLTLNASYSWDTSWGEVIAGATYSWVDEIQYSLFDTDTTRADEYDRIDLSLRWISVDEKWNMVFRGKNIEDKVSYGKLAHDGPDILEASINAPRTYSLEVNYSL
ncbi:TonB-dependent receptor [Pseudomaricurvus alkylphenolicus]|uniref:TonB-dependent receptor n=1 Tax=Pseudomaricurvus alkylphenolicus TaxID=1306991 RepID=UPI001421C04B|nr:TonB-dependent receptor [Pseudomaricurvus alkylphenolicus]NIB42348.1 TonB-dependent receptor [Pseudomaricurvus alkylphenolicus]